MVILGAFPVFKLGVLAVYQLSKPFSDYIKTKAKNNPMFRNYICIPSANTYNRMEVKLKMWAMNLGRTATVRPLNETAAIELAANLLGEGIVFVMCAAALTYEFRRQKRKEKKKKHKLHLEDEHFKNKIKEVNILLDEQEKQIETMIQLVKRLKFHKFNDN